MMRRGGWSDGYGRAYLDDLHGYCLTARGGLLHVPLQIDFQEFKDEVEFLVGVYDVQEPVIVV